MPEQPDRNRRRPHRAGRRRFGAFLVCSAVCATTAGPLSAQETIPHFPNGSTVILVPVQSTYPLEDGSWPGLASTEEKALRAMDAELEFAFGERRAAEDWILPSDLERTVERNPTLKIKPRRLAFSPLLVPIEDRKYIPEPLHSELRSLAALYDTRYLLVPVRLSVEAEPVDAARTGSEVAFAGGDAVAPAYRASLLLAMVDIRRSDVLWLGEIVGDPGMADSGSLLATLAGRVAGELAP